MNFMIKQNKPVKNILILTSLLLMFLTAGITFFYNTAYAAMHSLKSDNAVHKPKVLMILLNRVSVDDITGGSYRNINKLISGGSLGLMTVSTAGGYTDVNAYVTLGAGDRLLGDVRTGEAYNRGERLDDGTTGLDLYRRNVGNLSKNSRVLSVSVPSVVNANKEEYTLNQPGQLGTILHRHGLKTALIGNSDMGPGDPPNRIAASIVMDDLGCVDYGDVSNNLLKKDSDYPYGWRTDYNEVIRAVNRVWDKSDLIVVETGDSIRANGNSPQQLNIMKDFHRKNAIRQADDFIGKMLPRINDQVLLMLVTPLPQEDKLRDGIRLSPIVISGGSFEKSGILSSDSTRQRGLIANNDISSTIVEHFGISAAGDLLGQPVKGVKTDTSSPGYVKDLYNSLNNGSKVRNFLLFYYTRMHWIVFSALFLMVALGDIVKIPVAVYETTVLKTILILPLIILVTSVLPVKNIYLSLSLVLICTVVAAYGLNRIKNNYLFYMVVSALTVGIIVGDVLAGGIMMKKAALSYDMVMGGRFYGIGNEYMGVVIGAGILGFSSCMEHMNNHTKKIRLIAGLTFGALILFFAAPFAGTNAGGTLAALAGFVTAGYLYSGKKVTIKTAGALLGAFFSGLGALVAMNMAAPVYGSSHIGRSIDFLLIGNMENIWQTILRKWEANLFLLRNSPFSVVLILQILILIAVLIKENKRLSQLAKKEHYIFIGFVSIIIGSVVAFAFNDSGVIASAMMNNYVVIPLFLTLRGRRTESLSEGTA